MSQQTLEELKSSLRIIYADIMRGYSFSREENCYLKHYNDEDLAIIEEKVIDTKMDAKEKGLPSESERITELIENGTWSVEEEADLNTTKKSISNQTLHMGKTFGLERQQIEKDRDQLEEKAIKLERRRESILGLTLEKFMNRRRSDWTVYFSFYEDRECTKLVWSLEEFEDLDHQELGELVSEYNNIFSKYDHLNIRRIASQPYFLNKFFIADGNPRDFFGKSAITLTQFQSELMSQGRTYKNILENNDGSPPESWYEDPDKLVKWYYSKMKINSDGIKDSAGAKGEDWKGASTVPGADLEDLKAMADGANESVVDLGEEIEKMQKEKGADTLTFYDILRMHGEDPSSIEENMDLHEANRAALERSNEQPEQEEAKKEQGENLCISDEKIGE